LDFRGPITGSLKSPCTNSYRSSTETIALNCLVFEKIAFLPRDAMHKTKDQTALKNKKKIKYTAGIRPPSATRDQAHPSRRRSCIFTRTHASQWNAEAVHCICIYGMYSAASVTAAPRTEHWRHQLWGTGACACTQLGNFYLRMWAVIDC